MTNVNGPRGQRVTTPTPSTTNAAPTPQPSAAPTSPAQPQGWVAGTAGRPAVSASAAPPAPSAADLLATRPNPVRASLQSSVEQFTARIETTLNHDAMSLARGGRPVREGDPLTQGQQDALRDAAQDFVKDLPIGALSPELAQVVQQRLRDAGIETRDISSTRLRHLGRIGQDIAKDLLKDLKGDSPAAYYGLAGAAAAAIGAIGYAEGSAKLERLGIRPEVRTKFFDDKLVVKLGGEWEAHFKDFAATVTVGTNLSLGDAGRLTASASANSRTGFDNARLAYTYDRPNLNLSAAATFDQQGLRDVSGSVNYRPTENLRLSAAVSHDFRTDRTTAGAEAAWRLSNNADLAFSASHDSSGESRAGIGVRIRF
jgi:hypothetical protein